MPATSRPLPSRPTKRARSTIHRLQPAGPGGRTFQLIARREGVGAVLAKGMVAAAEALGLEDLAVHVKGLEPAGFDPRVLKGMGLSYATAARGACHLRGTFYKAELSGEIDRTRSPVRPGHDRL